MAVLSLPGLFVIFLLLFLRFDRRPTHISAGFASMFCEVVERIHFLLGNGFHLITQQALLKLWCWSLCQSHHLHKCKKNRLSVMVTSDGHKYSICSPSGQVLTLTSHAVKCGNITFHWPVGCKWMWCVSLLGEVPESCVWSPCIATAVFLDGRSSVWLFVLNHPSEPNPLQVILISWWIQPSLNAFMITHEHLENGGDIERREKKS